VIRNKVLGVCHFGSFYEAMDAAQHLVKLRPIAVELVDRTMIALGRDIAMFRPVIEATVRGDPDALLIVEFAEEDQPDNLQKLKQLSELMSDLGFGWTIRSVNGAAWLMSSNPRRRRRSRIFAPPASTS
jgi:hypothetical protein